MNNLLIELNQSNLQDLNDEGETLIQHRAIIKIEETDYIESSTFFTLRIGITRKTLVTLLKGEVEIDNITLKLNK